MLVIGCLTRATFPIMRGSSHPKRAKTTSDNRKTTHPPVTAAELGRVTTGYQYWLTRQPLSANTRRAYLGRVRQYCAYLATCVNDYGSPLRDPHGRDYAIRDFKSHLKKSCKATILNKQTNEGRTLLEKLSDHGAGAGFALVLLSADDVGRARERRDYGQPSSKTKCRF
jgi:hypothetical protein